MEILQYQEAKEKIKMEFDEKTRVLNINFVLANKKFNVGDIIKDSSTSIKITNINYSLVGSNIPLIRYKGRLLKKDLTPTKREIFETIFEEHAEQINL